METVQSGPVLLGWVAIPVASLREGSTMAIKWMTTDHKPSAKERLLLIVSAAGQPPDVQLIGKSEVKIGYWTGDAFRLMDEGEQPIGTRWARLADFLPAGIDLIHQRRFDADVHE